MKKIYSYVLMVTALLIGTNVWAEDGVIEIVRGGVTQATTYDHLGDAFAAAQDGDILQLTNNMTENQSTAAWFGQTTSGTLENYASTDRSITLDLKGHTYAFTGAALSKIVLTRGVLRIKSTGGKGEITSDKNVISVYGTYLKIDAKKDTPFSHLIVEENVKISSGTDDQYLAVVLDSPLRPYYVTNSWKWDHYPFDYACNIYGFIDDNAGVSNGARVDIYGELSANKYAFQVTGNLRCSKEYVNIDGSSREAFKKGPYYHRSGNKTAYRPFTTINGKDSIKSGNGIWYYYDETNSANDDYVVAYTDDSLYSPYVHIHPTAKLTTKDPSNPKAVGFYSSGYARCYIEGLCEGSTGVYVKSGEIELHDATVVSNWTSEYKGAANDLSVSGVSAGGSAIVIESKAGWTGNIDVTISGDTHVSTDHGYAIDEKVTKGGETKVNYLTITGGTFEGGQIPVRDENGEVIGHKQGTMIVSEQTLAANNNPDTITTITILGAQMTVNEEEATADSVGNITLAEFLAGQSGTHITYVEVPDPNNPSVTKTTMVISEGDAPATYEDPENPDAKTPWSWCADQSSDDPANLKSVAWTKLEDDTIKTGSIFLDELQINSGTGTAKGERQQLVINNGASLQVERLLMNSYARIIVEAGGKLIVNGTQGISAPSVNNIELRSTADEQAYFLFNPAVSSNKWPNAKVVVNTVCHQTGASPWTYIYQRIASPLKDTLTAAPANDFGTDMTKLYTHVTNTEFESYLFHWDMDQEKWVTGLWTEMAPFTGYQLANNSQAGGVKYTFAGRLVGNQNGDYRFAGEGFDFFGNSYTAPIYIENIFAHFNNAGVQASVWVYDYVAGNYITITPLDFEDGYPTWLHGNLPLKEIAPFAGFIMKLDDATNGNVAKLNYAAAIWGNPDVNPSAAPARRSQATADRVTLRVDAANGNADMIKFVQSDRFSEAFDNGADASKYFSENGINLYAVTNDGELARVATNDLENTVLAFQAGNATEYTISVPAQSGETFMLRDLVTNQTMMMEAGATYAFNQEAYSTNNARFEIVAAAKMPTAIDNTEVKANVKGIYTITGQYVGENFEILPAGVYVVNGVKIVK